MWLVLKRKQSAQLNGRNGWHLLKLSFVWVSSWKRYYSFSHSLKAEDSYEMASREEQPLPSESSHYTIFLNNKKKLC